QQWFSTGADDKAMSVVALRGPTARDGIGQVVWAGKSSAVGRHTYEVRVAKCTDGARAILLAPCPQVATGETAKHGRAAGVKALALQGEEDFLDGVVRHNEPDPSRPRRRTPRDVTGMRRTARTPRPPGMDHNNSSSCRSRRPVAYRAR